MISCALPCGATPQCLVTASASQVVPAATPTALTLGNVVSDTDTIHNAGNQTYTIHTAGIYTITAFLTTPSSYPNLFIGIKINDAYFAGITQLSANGSHLTTAAIVKLNSGDTIKAVAYSDVAFSTYFVSGQACSLSIVKIDSSTPPQCLITAGTSQFIPAATGTALTLSNVISDTDTIHDSGNQTYTIHTAGIYTITAFLTTPSSYPNLFIGIKINNTYFAGITQVSANGSHLTTGAIIKLNSGDTIKAIAYSDVAFSTYFVSGQACSLSIVKIGD